jgi:hypothetical protein
MKPTITTHNHAPATLEQVEQLAMDRAESDAFEVAQTFANCRKPPLTDAQKLADKLVACQKQAAVFFDYEELMQWHEGKKNGRVTEKADPFLLIPCAPITPTEPTFSVPPIPSADPSTLLDSTISLVEKLKIEAVAEANHQPVVDALCTACGQPTAQWVVAQNAAVIQELNEELMHPDRNGDEDGFWWFVLHLLALIAVFGLGCAVGGAV